MSTVDKREVWQRGPVENIPGLLQPVAHALLQAREEVNEIMLDFPSEQLWQKPAGVASVAFHLQHLTGVLDRLFSYAKGEALNAEQLASLKAEGQQQPIEAGELVNIFNAQVDKALAQLSTTK